ncbi:MAG: translation elongation factor Ts [Lachnospiraceae bacterium]|nr:translation elongation factor Ts [Lachnospiraceae bacterium]
MANITAAMVKELREMTGAGMMDCKKALNETDGDMDAAVEFLRKSGAAKAEKKASRIAAEGICRIACDGNKAVVAEVNSETDFVAKNEVFQEFVQKVADTALASGLNGGKNGEDVEALLEKDGLKDLLVEKTAKIGEKLSVRRFEKIEAEAVATYIHGGGRIGVLVAANGASDDAAKEALTNIAMQVAAMSPEYLSRNDISAESLAKEKEITIDSALNDPASLPKPIQNAVFDKALEGGRLSDADTAVLNEKRNDKYLFNFLSEEAKNVLAGIAIEGKAEYVDNKIFSGLVEGRISKHLKEICLMDQVYVRAEDGKQTVAKYLESVNKDLKIAKFIRFEVGEGMEKKNEDFAAEVAAQMAGN